MKCITAGLTINLSWLKVLIAIPSIACINCFADNLDELSGTPFADNSYNSFHETHFIPTRMMDNDTLFIAAEEERNNTMNWGLKLANNLWLASRNNSEAAGKKAVQAYLKVNFLALLRFNKKPQSESNAKNTDKSQFTNINNYKLSVSGEKFRLRFKYAF